MFNSKSSRISQWVPKQNGRAEVLLYKGVCKDNMSRILGEAEGLSCPCYELKRMCHEYMNPSHLKMISPCSFNIESVGALIDLA
jgi:hypothetical protein